MNATEINAEPPSGSLRIDKTIPIALIVMFISQIAAFSWYASSVTSSIADHERRLTAMEKYQENTMLGPTGMSERLTRLEEKQSSAQKSLDRIETLITAQPPSQPERSRR